ncbi:MAG: hypothetical protein ABSF46_34155 [Terriglobia bacterium]|jgi:hypothetical protein
MNVEVRPGWVKPFRVGLLSFSDGRLRVHRTLENTHGARLTEAIGKDPLLAPVATSQIAHSSKFARQVAAEMKAAGVEAVVFTFLFSPSLISALLRPACWNCRCS